MKIVNSETQVSSSISPLSKVNIHSHTLAKSTTRDIVIKLLKTSDKKILKAASGGGGRNCIQRNTKSQQTNQKAMKGHF